MTSDSLQSPFLVIIKNQGALKYLYILTTILRPGCPSMEESKFHYRPGLDTATLGIRLIIKWTILWDSDDDRLMPLKSIPWSQDPFFEDHLCRYISWAGLIEICWVVFDDCVPGDKWDHCHCDQHGCVHSSCHQYLDQTLHTHLSFMPHHFIANKKEKCSRIFTEFPGGPNYELSEKQILWINNIECWNIDRMRGAYLYGLLRRRRRMFYDGQSSRIVNPPNMAKFTIVVDLVILGNNIFCRFMKSSLVSLPVLLMILK